MALMVLGDNSNDDRVMDSYSKVLGVQPQKY